MLISKYPLIEIDENEIKLIESHVFFFKSVSHIVIVTRLDKSIKTLPNPTSLKLWLRTEFKIFSHMEEEGKKASLQKKEESLYLEDLVLSLMVGNQFSFLQFERNPFLNEPKIVRADNILKYTAPNLFLMPYEVEEYTLADETIAEVVKDYLEHFPQFDEVLKWVIACRFTNQRRNSYVYLRVNAGFGKSLFASIFEGIGIGKKIKQTQLKDNSAGDLAPESFRNIFAMIIDEFTHFSQEMKDITNSIALTAKFQLSEIVPLYAKIFLSAEKSTSFYGDAGVDSQLADRVNVIDLSTTSTKIENRKLYKEIGNAVYCDALRVHTMKVITDEVERYIKMGRVESDKEAINALNVFFDKYRVESTTIDKIKEKIYGYLIDFVEWEAEQKEMRPRNTFFEQLEHFIAVKNDDEVIVRDAVKMYEIMLKHSGEQFAKVAKFKQTALDEILGVSLEDKGVKTTRNRKSIRGAIVNLPLMIKSKKTVPVEFIDGEGRIDKNYKFDGENILDAEGKEIF